MGYFDKFTDGVFNEVVTIGKHIATNRMADKQSKSVDFMSKVLGKNAPPELKGMFKLQLNTEISRMLGKNMPSAVRKLLGDKIGKAVGDIFHWGTEENSGPPTSIKGYKDGFGSQARPPDPNEFANRQVTELDDTVFSLQNFIAEVGDDARRLSKGYYYQVTFFFNSLDPDSSPSAPMDEKLIRKLTFFCSSVNLPGWRADTQQVSIYGVKYEVVCRIEQDPLWVTFKSDILHRIPNTFFSNIRNGQSFSNFGKNLIGGGDNSAYAPKYKDTYQFTVMIEILDENFKPVAEYIFEKCFLKTVQQMQYGMDKHDIPETTVEIIYERVNSRLTDTHSRTPVASPEPTAPSETSNSWGNNTGFEAGTS